MSTYTVIFRTCAWDDDIAEVAARARASCGNGQFVVAADETNGAFSVEPYPKLSYTDDIKSFGLPRIPSDRFLWWNVDYVLYAARRRLAETNYYVMLRYDVYLHCDLDDVIERCSREEIDFVAHELRPLPETHWSRESVRDMMQEPWCAQIPLLILSGRAIDELFRVRQAMALALKEGWIKHWPYCEAFIPSVIVRRREMASSELRNFVNVDLLRSRPILNLNDARLTKPGVVAHPVMAGRRFSRAYLATEPVVERSLFQFASEQDPTAFQEAFVELSFGDSDFAGPSHPHRLRHFRMDSSLEDERGTEGLAVILEEQASKDLLVKTVTAIVHEKVFGRGLGLYDIDSVASLSASIESSQYAITHMSEAKRFATGNLLRDFAIGCTPVSGMILEFGVYSGYTINRFAALVPERRIVGFDSFEGLPETWNSTFRKGSLRCTKLPAVRDNVELVVGWFDTTLQQFLAKHPNDPVALLHIDCDLYSSTNTVLSLLASRIVPGTVIVFDEYFNFPGWRKHEYRAFQEFVQSNKVKYEYVGLVAMDCQVIARIMEIH